VCDSVGRFLRCCQEWQKHWTRCKNKEDDEFKEKNDQYKMQAYGFSPENFGTEIVIIDIDTVRFLSFQNILF
jgi:hypothetical protein